MKLTLRNIVELDRAKARFWDRVIVTGPDTCWLWTGRVDADGYGRVPCLFRNGYAPMIASRFSFEMAFGEVADGLMVCHQCDTRSCVNPLHLWVGSNQDNLRDMSAKGRARGQDQTHCIHGHEFTPENTYIRTRGLRRRQCRKCNAEAVARLKRRKAAA